MTISDNILRNLKELGVNGVEPFETRPDRLFCWDLLGELEAHFHAHPEHWLADHLDPLHGASMRENWREKATPSMQCVKHAISQVNHPHLPDDAFWEIDFDEQAPTNPAYLAEHLGVCIVHAIRHSTTDENAISAGLDKRYAKESADGQSA
jgi:hypothetical protein